MFSVYDLPTESNYDRGRFYGSLARERIHRAISGYRVLVHRFLGRKEVRHRVARYFAAAEKWVPGLADELDGVADGADVAAEDVMLLNARSELLQGAFRVPECTSVAVSGSRRKGGGGLVAQTWDWLPSFAPGCLFRRAGPSGDRPAYLAFAEPGQLAKIGVNAAGLAVGINFLPDPPGEAAPDDGVPVHLIVAAVLGESCVANALEFVAGYLPAAGSVHLMLADAAGAVASVEVSPARVTVDEGSPEFHEIVLAHANDFQHPERARKADAMFSRMTGASPRPVRADAAWERADRLCDGPGAVGWEGLRAVLACHEGAATSCVHPTGVGNDTATLAAFVLDPAGGAIRAVRGPACGEPWDRYPVRREDQ